MAILAACKYPKALLTGHSCIGLHLKVSTEIMSVSLHCSMLYDQYILYPIAPPEYSSGGVVSDEHKLSTITPSTEDNLK